MTRYLAIWVGRVAAVLILTCGAALAQSTPDPTAAEAGSQNTLKLTTVLMALPAGTPWFSLNAEPGLSYGHSGSARDPGGRDPQDLPPYSAVFKTEFERAGFKVVVDDDLFNRESSGAADYQVAAVITDALANACMSTGGILSAGKKGDVSGTGSLKVDLADLFAAEKEVVARIQHQRQN